MARFVVPRGQSSMGGNAAAAAADAEDGYLERVAKYIPAEILTAYVALLNIAPTDPAKASVRSGILIVAAIACFILTPIYFYFRAKPPLPKRLQIIIATVAFVVWSYALGGIWIERGLHQPEIASALLILFTLVAGIFEPKPGDP